MTRSTLTLALLAVVAAFSALVACGDEETTGAPIGGGNDGGGFTVDSGTTDSSFATDSADSATATDGGEVENVVTSLSGLRWELPCQAAAADPALCTTPTTNVTKTTTLAGASGATYAVKLRFRGVIEPKTYSGGTETGFFSVGGTPASDTANIYRLTVSAPAGTFFVNSGTTRASTALYAEAIDYEATVDIQAGATVTLTAEPLDALQIKNRDMAGAPFVIAGIAPAPAPFDGQFVQMDVVSVTKK